jgi:UDP:flavonoid glycosyltransferase YjiC (YdhE family)
MWRRFAARQRRRRDVTQQPPCRAEFDGYPIVCGISPALIPQPRDWPERFVIAGHWWLPHVPAWTPPPTLAAFLDAGEAPVYIGFGSMVGFDREQVRALVLDALEERRALLFSGWSGFGAGDLLDGAAGRADPARLAAAAHGHLVVHHGGAGTTHAAARAACRRSSHRSRATSLSGPTD